MWGERRTRIGQRYHEAQRSPAVSFQGIASPTLTLSIPQSIAEGLSKVQLASAAEDPADADRGSKSIRRTRINCSPFELTHTGAVDELVNSNLGSSCLANQREDTEFLSFEKGDSLDAYLTPGCIACTIRCGPQHCIPISSNLLKLILITRLYFSPAIGGGRSQCPTFMLTQRIADVLYPVCSLLEPVCVLQAHRLARHRE